MNASEDPAASSLLERLALPALLLIAIAVGLGLGAWLFAPIPGASPLPPAASATYLAITAVPAPVVGAPAPDFTLKDMQGRAVQLAGLRGQPVLIAFWATWCEPCRVELPALNAEAGRIKILAVNYGESRETAQAYLTAIRLDALQPLLDPDLAVRDLYLVNALPTSFLVDASGTLRYLKIGLLDKSELDAALAALGGTP
jgi:peroxiredoxin